MRLRNLFMILLLCMTVGMFGVSCVDDGEDGAQGPPGPPGPAGPAGEDASDDMAGGEANYYDFLESWGVEDGAAACADDILTGSGPFPGPAALQPITMPEATDTPVALRCDAAGANETGVLVTTASTAVDPQIVVAGQTIVAEGEIVLVKTMRGEEEESVVDTPSSEFNQATRTTITKNFVGGLVFATMRMNGGHAEADERRLLYNECGIGNAPPAIRGHWRGIKIVEAAQVFVDGVGAVTDDTPPVAETTDVTTVKVCVKLDAHPGVTKCYINIDGGPDAGAQIALYNEDGSVTTIKDNDALVGEGGTAIDATTGTLFTADDLPGAEEVCEIFDEGEPEDN